MNHKGWQDLAKVCSICNDATVVFEEGKFARVGEPTEAALAVLVEKVSDTTCSVVVYICVLYSVAAQFLLHSATIVACSI
jgi:magnesium-transporting ATPase (P-type)